MFTRTVGGKGVSGKSIFDLAHNSIIGRKSMHGPRFDRKGEVIPRSIVGEKDAFQRMRSMHVSRSRLQNELDRPLLQKPRTEPHRLTSLKNHRQQAASALGYIESLNESPVKRQTQQKTGGAGKKVKMVKQTVPLSDKNFTRLVEQIRSRTLRTPALTEMKDKDSKAIESYERMQKFWKYQESLLSSRIKRGQTVFRKAESFRDKLEQLERSEKRGQSYGENLWYMSLRNSGQEGSRTIPMGDTGLFVRVKETALKEKEHLTKEENFKVRGENKLVSELQSAMKINQKSLFLDHIRNESGEGEPSFEEYTIEEHYEPLSTLRKGFL